MRRRPFLAGVLMIALAAGGAGLYAATAAGRFDPAVWQAEYKGSPLDHPRSAMVRDLRSRVLKPGMTREEVLSLLGKPDTRLDERRLRWDLGTPPASIDEEWLVIEFDERERLIGHTIQQG